MRMGKTELKYIIGIVILILMGYFTFWAQQNISPQLGIFFGFVTGYVAAVLVFFYILGRYGG
jgi:uncharacterized membrane protein